MATVKKRKRKARGKKYTSDRYYVRYTDHRGDRHRVAAFTDRRASESMARRIEELAACRATGTRPDKDLSTALDRLPERVLDHLRGVGLLTESQVAGARPIEDHLQSWETHLEQKGDTAKHVQQRTRRARDVLEAAGATWWHDIDADRVEAALANMRDVEGLSGSTVNAYQSAVKQFTRWLYRSGRAPENPLRRLSRQRAQPSRRRRALTSEECTTLLQTTREQKQHHGMPGPERALLYRVALETGLRWSELHSLKRRNLNLDGDPPTVTVEAAYTKSRREDTLPLREQTARALADHIRLKMPEAPVFSMWQDKGGEMLERDLEAAGIPKRDENGRVVDFHALRHTFITNLAKGGVHPKVAQSLARHSTISLTLDRYTHVVMDSKTEGVAALPDLSGGKTERDAKDGA